MPTSFELVGSEYVTGFRQQVVWKVWIAIAFFWGKLGVGLLIFALFLNSPLLALAGILVEDIGKSGALMIHLGRPERFWRAIMRPRTSWISRTVWMMGIFTVLGAIYLLLPQGGAAWQVLRVLVGISAVVVALTDGFVINNSPAIPLWNTTMMPLLFLLYSLLGGSSLVLFLHHGGWLAIPWGASFLRLLEVSLISINLLAVIIYLASMGYATAPARASLQLLVKGTYAGIFFGLVVAVGFLFTLVMTLALAATAGPFLVGMITLADFIGHFFIFYLFLLAGVYSPVFGKLTI